MKALIFILTTAIGLNAFAADQKEACKAAAKRAADFAIPFAHDDGGFSPIMLDLQLVSENAPSFIWKATKFYGVENNATGENVRVSRPYTVTTLFEDDECSIKGLVESEN